MSIDGVFIHYLVQELEETIGEGKVNKIQQPSPLTLIFQIRKYNQNVQLLISSELSAPRIYLTNSKWPNPEQPYQFCMVLRKYLDRSLLLSIKQIDNDRLIDFTFQGVNELGDEVIYHLYVEIMGRNSNIILTTHDQIIIDAIRKLPPAEENTRIIIPKAKYLYAFKQASINPLSSDLSDEEKLTQIEQLEGCSKLIKNEFKFQNSVNQVIQRTKEPILFITPEKTFFYAFNLHHLAGERKRFPTLSELLDHVFQAQITENVDYSEISKLIKRELHKQTTKFDRLQKDFENAKSTLADKHLAILLQANLYRVKERSNFVIVEDFLHDQQETIIPLDPKLTPSDNLKQYFSKQKKAKNALTEVEKQIRLCQDEIEYLETLLTQLGFASAQELSEIKEELREYGYLRESTKQKSKKTRKITTYHVDGSEIMVGKNNIQNNYLTHTLAKKNDYWFHVKNAPGAHVVLRCAEPTEKLIRLSAMLASYYSSMKTSSSVPVDYTQVKFIKKIPGQKGSNVTYTHQKTIYIDPDLNIIKEQLGI